MRTSSDDLRCGTVVAIAPRNRLPGLRLAGCFASLLLAAAASVAADDPSTGAPGLQVRVLLYSGRPDPSFVIGDNARITQFKQLFDQATPDPSAAGERKTVLPSILGYKGLLVENPSRLGGLPRTLAVYGEKVEARDGETRFFVHGGALETFLIEEATKARVLDDKAIELIKAARGGSTAEPR